MTRLINRNFIVGVTGSIAAYKAAELTRSLIREGANVRVIMTEGACEFITPLTLQALSGHEVHTDLLDTEAEAAMGHIELARWADVMIIAPATADVIARLAQGRADDLLTTVALATPAPVAVAPAMNQQMWAHAATQENIQMLASRHIQIIGPDAGEQACGDVGPGRLLDPEAIVAAVNARFESRLLEGRRVVITAGPTFEAIDPVRYLSNHSSGKMGFALAGACAEAGAQVELISGPVHLDAPNRVTLHPVTSATEMCEQALALSAGADVFIGAAAVADYRPESASAEKIKKADGNPLILTLVENPDIIACVARSSSRPSMVVGFAAETASLMDHAREKRQRKGLDMIIANDVSDPDTTFGSEQNAVHLITATEEKSLPLASKRVIAEQIVAAVAATLDR